MPTRGFSFRSLMQRMNFNARIWKLRFRRFTRTAAISALLLMSIQTLFRSLPAEAHPIDMEAIAQIESSNNPKAVSKDGSVGLYQITPVCLKHFIAVEIYSKVKFRKSKHPDFCCDWKDIPTSEDLLDSDISSEIANWYIQWIFDSVGGWKSDYPADVLIAWNWGYGHWEKWNRNGSKFKKLPKTTQDYLKKYEQLTGEAL